MMKITDLHGMEITVTDLHEAIAKAEEFSSYDTTTGSTDFLRRQRLYWNDLLLKLYKLPQD